MIVNERSRDHRRSSQGADGNLANFAKPGQIRNTKNERDAALTRANRIAPSGEQSVYIENCDRRAVSRCPI